jgi:hypothetical protein
VTSTPTTDDAAADAATEREYTWRDRRPLPARLASGRAVVALMLPVAAGMLVATVLRTAGLLVGPPAIVRNGVLEPVLAGTGPGIAWSLAAVLVLEVAALWGIGAALAVLAQESDGVPVRWREVWLWPVRHPRAALVLAGVGVLVQVAVVAAVLLLALLLAWVGVDASVGWSPVMLVAAGLAVLTALGPVIRGAGRRLLVGDERHPGMLRSAPAWGQDRPLRGYLAFGGLLAVGATVGWQRLTEARGWPEWLDDPVRALLGAAFVLLVAVVVVDDCSHGLPVPGASRTPARGLLRWAGGAAVVVVPALLLIVVTQVNPWGAVRVEQSRVPWSPGPLVTGVADGDLLLDGQATRPDYVGLCRGLDCVQALGSTKNAGLALGTDDGLLWEARWTVDGRAIDESGELLGEGWQDLPAVLTLRSVDVDAFWSDAWAAGADQQQISLDERPALAEVELARSTWGAMSPNGDPAGAIVDLPVALDARDGTLGEPRHGPGLPGPLHRHRLRGGADRGEPQRGALGAAAGRRARPGRHALRDRLRRGIDRSARHRRALAAGAAAGRRGGGA